MTQVDPAAIQEEIASLAQTAGIDIVGYADADPFHGYALRDSRRRDPRLSMPTARSIIVFGIYIGGLVLPAWQDPCCGRTSRLYLSGYFLDVIKPLRPMAAYLERQGYRAMICDGRSAETSILPLKLAAVRAGLGWQGKHSLLISQKYGTFLALGGIISDADFGRRPPPQKNRCGDCDRCQTACPLEALAQDYCLNMQACLSYQLQDSKLSRQAQAVMQNRILDCEICQQVCPWNQKHIKKPLPTRLTQAFQTQIGDWERFFYLPDLIGLSQTAQNQRLGPLMADIPFDLLRRNEALAADRCQQMQK